MAIYTVKPPEPHGEQRWAVLKNGVPTGATFDTPAAATAEAERLAWRDVPEEMLQLDDKVTKPVQIVGRRDGEYVGPVRRLSPDYVLISGGCGKFFLLDRAPLEAAAIEVTINVSIYVRLKDGIARSCQKAQGQDQALKGVGSRCR